MKTSYDPATDSLYIHLANRASIDSDEVTEGIVLDYDLNGVMVGIDVQRTSQRIDLSGEAVKRSGHEGNANEQEERALSERRVAQAKSFDALPCLESKLDDLALGQFDAYRREAVDAEIHHLSLTLTNIRCGSMCANGCEPGQGLRRACPGFGGLAFLALVGLHQLLLFW